MNSQLLINCYFYFRNEVYTETRVGSTKKRNDTEDTIPLYANVEGRQNEINEFDRRPKTGELGSQISRTVSDKKKSTHKNIDTESDSLEKPQISNKANNRVRRTEKLSTPEKINTSITSDKDIHKTKKVLDAGHSNSGSLKDNQYKRRQKQSKDTHIMMHNKDNGQVKEIKIPETAKKNDSIKRSNGHTVKDKNIKEMEPHPNKNIGQNSLEYRKQSNITKDGTDRVNNNSNGRRRTEYVIKYDDKIGTVSSISKVRPGHSTPRKKHSSKDRNKEYTKDSKSKNTEKSALRK